MRILLIEDDENKAEKLRAYLVEIVRGAEVITCGSYHSAILVLGDNRPDLIVLDMTIPTFDVSPEEVGGSTQKQGGKNILRHMIRKNIATPVIVVTQYDNFGESGNPVSLNQLIRDLGKEYARLYIGTIYYNSAQTKWKDDLKALLVKTIGTKKRK